MFLKEPNEYINDDWIISWWLGRPKLLEVLAMFII